MWVGVCMGVVFGEGMGVGCLCLFLYQLIYDQPLSHPQFTRDNRTTCYVAISITNIPPIRNNPASDYAHVGYWCLYTYAHPYCNKSLFENYVPQNTSTARIPFSQALFRIRTRLQCDEYELIYCCVCVFVGHVWEL